MRWIPSDRRFFFVIIPTFTTLQNSPKPHSLLVVLGSPQLNGQRARGSKRSNSPACRRKRNIKTWHLVGTPHQTWKKCNLSMNKSEKSQSRVLSWFFSPLTNPILSQQPPLRHDGRWLGSFGCNTTALIVRELAKILRSPKLNGNLKS